MLTEEELEKLSGELPEETMQQLLAEMAPQGEPNLPERELQQEREEVPERREEQHNQRNKLPPVSLTENPVWADPETVKEKMRKFKEKCKVLWTVLYGAQGAATAFEEKPGKEKKSGKEGKKAETTEKKHYTKRGWTDQDRPEEKALDLDTWNRRHNHWPFSCADQSMSFSENGRYQAQWLEWMCSEPEFVVVAVLLRRWYDYAKDGKRSAALHCFRFCFNWFPWVLPHQISRLPFWEDLLERKEERLRPFNFGPYAVM